MKQEYSNLYDKISPILSNEELIEKMLRKAENMDNKKKIRFKKTLTAIIAAAIAVTAATVTAAATGIIDFKTIFGDFIDIADENAANSLLSQPKDLKWTVSDDNYEIKMNGVAGTDSCVLMNFEIVRKDGKPVVDYFLNKPVGNALEIVFGGVHSKEVDGGIVYQDWKFSINENGNIQAYIIADIKDNINGAVIECSGSNFYPDERLINYELEHKVFRNIKNGETGLYYPGGALAPEHSIVDPEILGLMLDWSLEFSYNAPQNCTVTKKIENTDEQLVINKYIAPKEENGAESDKILLPLEMKIIESSFNHVSGKITTEFYESESTKHALTYMDENEIFIITENGAEIPVSIHEFGGFGTDSGYTQMYLNVIYSADNSYEITVIDVSTITAIKINNTVFNLQ